MSLTWDDIHTLGLSWDEIDAPNISWEKLESLSVPELRKRLAEAKSDIAAAKGASASDSVQIGLGIIQTLIAIISLILSLQSSSTSPHLTKLLESQSAQIELMKEQIVAQRQIDARQTAYLEALHALVSDLVEEGLRDDAAPQDVPQPH